VLIEDRNLFPTPGPDSDKQRLDLEIDRTIGGRKEASNDDSPDANAFGFHIMSGGSFKYFSFWVVLTIFIGPPKELTSLSKRDGSHWQLFGCDPAKGELRQTVKAICTDGSETSNCGEIFEGGVPATIVEMPGHCGPGKYAVAVDLQPSESHQHLHNYLHKRGLDHSHVYDFTFDYDYSPIEKRGAASNVLLRIDYSDHPGYWKKIVGKFINLTTSPFL
jgi:chitinase